MTTQTYRLKIARVNSLKLKVQSKFPAAINTGNFLKLTSANGIYTFDVDYSVLTPGPISDPATAYVAIEDKTAGIYREVSLASLLTSGIDADLQAIAALTGAGVLVRTADDTWTLRAVTGTANEITVTNGDGVSGNPTLSLPAALTFTGKTVTGGTFQNPAINAPTGIVKGDVGLGNVDNTSDVNKPVSTATQAALNGKQPLDADLTAIAALSSTGLARRTGTNTWSVGTTVSNGELATAADGTIKSNISGGTATPSDNTITAVLDKLFGTTHGSVIYRGASTWGALTPGTSGNFLKTQGAAANPIWAAVPGGGDMLSTNNLSDVANVTTARTNLSAAKSGANSDITSLSGLTTALSVAQGGTGDTGTAWTSSSPTVTASSGTFTSVSATMRSKTIGKMFYFKLTVTITTAGTAAGIMQVALPVTLSSGTQVVAVSLGSGAVGSGTAGASTLSLFNSAGASLIASGVSVFASGVLETN